MKYASAGMPTLREPRGPLPGGVVALTTAPKRLVPTTAHLCTERAERVHVGRYGVVREVTAHNARKGIYLASIRTIYRVLAE